MEVGKRIRVVEKEYAGERGVVLQSPFTFGLRKWDCLVKLDVHSGPVPFNDEELAEE